MVKERLYADSFDYCPFDNDWDFKVRVVTRAELDAQRRQMIETRKAEVRENFWQHTGGEDFVEACCKLLEWMTKECENASGKTNRQSAKKRKTSFAPWRDFHGNQLKVFAYKRQTKPHTMSVWGMLAGQSLCGCVQVPIRHFANNEDYQEWISHPEEALAEFVGKMREERLYNGEICVLCKYYHLNECMDEYACASLPKEESTSTLLT